MTKSKHCNKRTREQKLLDHIFIEERVLRGMRQIDIAAELSKVRPYTLSRQQIQKDIEKLRLEWQALATAMVDQIKAKELAGLDLQERELFVAWERSKQHAESETRESVSVKDGKGSKKLPAEKVKKTKEGQCGDPAYMRLILEIRDRRAKLLGLDAPVRQEVQQHVTGTVQVNRQINYSKLSVEELEQLDYLIDKAGPGQVSGQENPG